MEPLKLTDPERKPWLELLTLLCKIGAAAWIDTQHTEERRASFVELERQRRAQCKFRSR